MRIQILLARFWRGVFLDIPSNFGPRAGQDEELKATLACVSSIEAERDAALAARDAAIAEARDAAATAAKELAEVEKEVLRERDAATAALQDFEESLVAIRVDSLRERTQAFATPRVLTPSGLHSGRRRPA